MGVRLPGRHDDAFHFGGTVSVDQANYDGNYTYGNGNKGVYRQNTTPVGSFPPNAWGLFDMHGNVWEWCHGLVWGPYPSRELKDPQSVLMERARVLRGGCWGHLTRGLPLRLSEPAVPGTVTTACGCRVVLCLD